MTSTRVGGDMPPLPLALGPEIDRFRVPIHCELPRLSDNRCESWWPPPLSRVPQPASIQTRPVSESWRALLVSYTYIGICDDSRRCPTPNRVTRSGPNRPQKSRTAPKVSKPRDAVPTRHAMEVVADRRVAETTIFPVWRRLPVAIGIATTSPSLRPRSMPPQNAFE